MPVTTAGRGGRLPSGVSCRPRRYFVKFHFTQSLLNTESEAVRFSTKEAPRRLHHICNCEAVLYETKSEAITPAGVPLQPASQVPSTRYTKQHLHPRRGPITGHRSNRAPRAAGSERALPWSETCCFCPPHTRCQFVALAAVTVGGHYSKPQGTGTRTAMIVTWPPLQSNNTSCCPVPRLAPATGDDYPNA